MAEPTRIQVWNNDALEVVGDFDLADADGGKFKQHGKVRLCRCGISRTKTLLRQLPHPHGFQERGQRQERLKSINAA